MSVVRDRQNNDVVGQGRPLDGGSAGGEANTASNEGGGSELVLPKSGVNLPFRTLVAGSNVQITTQTGTLTISAIVPTPGEANTTSNEGGAHELALPKSGVNLPFRTLVAGSNVQITDQADTLTISAIVPVPGESNTTSNEGGAYELALPKTGVNLPFRTISAGTNISITQAAQILEISSTGESNTTSNQGGGAGLALAKVGVDLPFKSIIGGTNVTITEQADTITISAVVPVPGEANTSSNQGAGLGLALPKSGVDLPFKSLVAGSNVQITSQADTVTIASQYAGQISKGGVESFSTGSIDSGRNSVNVVWAIHVLALFTITIDEITMMVTNIGTDNWWAGIYDSSGNLASTTAQLATPATTGFYTAPLATPITVNGGTDFWFAFKGDFGSTNWGAQDCWPDFDLSRQVYYATPGLPADINSGGATVADRCFYFAAINN